MDDLITYVIHYTPLKERKHFQLNQLDKLSLKNNVFIEKYDKENLEVDDLIKFNKKKNKSRNNFTFQKTYLYNRINSEKQF